jgi:RHS repeat-associated protein
MAQALVWLDWGKFALAPFDALEGCIGAFLSMYYNGDISLEGLKALIEIGDPVDAVSGAYMFEDDDLKIYGDWPLLWRRCYNSLDGDGSGGMGKGFSHPYDFTLRDEYGIIYIQGPHGDLLSFLRQKDVSGGDRYVPLQGTELLFSLKSADRDSYVLDFKGSLYLFSDGRLDRVESAGGHVIASLEYGPDGLSRVSNRAGGLEVSWDGGLIKEVRDGTGRAVRYGYDDGVLASVTNPDGDSLGYSHDGNGFISAVRDFEGNLYLENTYDGKGRVTSQTMHTAGGAATMSVEYGDEGEPDSQGLFTNTVHDFNGAVRKYLHDGEYRVVRVEDEEGAVENTWADAYRADSRLNGGQEGVRHAFDGAGDPTRAEYQDGAVLLAEYDGRHRITKITYHDGTWESFAYEGGNLAARADRNGNICRWTYRDGILASFTDAEGNRESYCHDANGFLTSARDASGGTVTLDNDALGRVTSMTDPLGAVTSYEYTPAGKLLKETLDGGEGLRFEKRFSYDKNGLVTRSTDYRGNAETTVYGPMGRMLRRVDREGNVTTRAYAPDGALVSETDWNGSVTRYGHDLRGRLSWARDALGNEESYAYDAQDRLVSVTDPLGNAETYAYDVMGRLARVTDRNGNVTERAYDLDGRLAKETRRNPMGRDAVTSYAYDPAGNLLSVTGPEGNVTAYAYYRNGLLKSATDPEGRVTSYSYDPSGRLSSLTDGEGGSTRWRRDLAGNVTAVIDPLGNERVLERDRLSRLAAETSPEGRRTSYARDADGNVVSVTDPEGNVSEYAYDGLGRVTSATDRLGNVTRAVYAGTYGVGEAIYPDGRSERWEHDALGRVAKHVARGGGATAYFYDPCGRLAKTTDAEGYEDVYVYDKGGRLKSQARDGVVLAERGYDAFDRVVAVKDPKGVARYERDLDGLVTALTDKNGARTLRAYDKSGLPVSVTDPEGGVTAWRHDMAGRLVGKTDARGLATALALDAAGRVVSAAESDGARTARTAFSYDNDGLLTSVVGPEGERTELVYDARGFLARHAAIGRGGVGLSTWEYVRDPEGRAVRVTDPMGADTSYSYDFKGDVLSWTDRLNHVESYAYDADGNLARVTGRGSGGGPVNDRRVVTYSYDKLGRLTGERGSGGSAVSFAYDAFNLVKRVSGKAPDEAVTLYESGPLGDPISKTGPMGDVERYATDAEGAVTMVAYADGDASRYERDGLGRVRKASHAGMEPWEYAYDPMGAVTMTKDGTGERLYARDAWGRLSKAETPEGAVSYSYDRSGRRTGLTYPDGTKATWLHDPMGRLSALEHDGGVTRYRHDDAGRLVRKDLPSGESVSYAYNAEGYRTEVKEVDKAGRARRQTTYAYRDDGLLRREDRTGVGAAWAMESLIYGYDGEGRLSDVRATRDGAAAWKAAYVYDARGGMAHETWEGYGAATDTAYARDLAGRLLSKTVAKGGAAPETTTYEYDRRGNLVKETSPLGAKTYAYDGAGKLIQGTNAEGETSRYAYDALGARVFHEETKADADARHQNGAFRGGSRDDGGALGRLLRQGRAAWQRAWETTVGTVARNDMGTASRHYLPDRADGGAMRDLYVLEDGSWAASRVYDGTGLSPLAARLSYAPETERTGVYKGESPGSNPASDIAAKTIGKVWPRGDANLSSPLFGTGSDGSILFHMERDPWGVPLTDARLGMNLSGVDDAAAFTGYQWDEVLGLHFAQARFYDPGSKQFVQEDPHWNVGNMIYGDAPTATSGGRVPLPDGAAIRQAANPYAYCLNSPVNYTDPSGELLPVIAIAIVVVASGVVGAGADVAVQITANGGDWGSVDMREAIAAGAASAVGTALTVATGGAAAPVVVETLSAATAASLGKAALTGGASALASYLTENAVMGNAPTFAGATWSVTVGGFTGAATGPKSYRQFKSNKSFWTYDPCGEKKKVTSEYGRAGVLEHQFTIQEILKNLEDKGYILRTEKKLTTPGGEKPERYGDIIVKDGETGEMWVIQVGKQTKAGNPVSRERAAIKDLERQNYKVEFVPYN